MVFDHARGLALDTDTPLVRHFFVRIVRSDNPVLPPYLCYLSHRDSELLACGYGHTRVDALGDVLATWRDIVADARDAADDFLSIYLDVTQQQRCATCGAEYDDEDGAPLEQCWECARDARDEMAHRRAHAADVL